MIYRTAGFICEVLIFAKFASVGELANLNSEATLLLSFAVTRVMSILKYFKRVDIAAALPDPKGPLSDQVPSASISEANKEVMKTIAAVDKEPQKKGPLRKRGIL